VPGWLRSGNTGPAPGNVPFLRKALVELPGGTWPRTVPLLQFSDQAPPQFLGTHDLNDVVVALLTATSQAVCA
jgi:hypothetical protein